MKGYINADLLKTNSSIKPHSPAKPGSMDRHNSWICEASDSRALKERFFNITVELQLEQLIVQLACISWAGPRS